MSNYISTRAVQARRLYAVLRAAGYLKDEGEIDRFASRFGTSLERHGFYAVLLTDDELSKLPDDLSADNELMGGGEDG